MRNTGTTLVMGAWMLVWPEVLWDARVAPSWAKKSKGADDDQLGGLPGTGLQHALDKLAGGCLVDPGDDCAQAQGQHLQVPKAAEQRGLSVQLQQAVVHRLLLLGCRIQREGKVQLLDRLITLGAREPKGSPQAAE